MIDSRQLHRHAGAAAADLIARVTPEQFGSPTPCSEWDVRALINHMVVGNRLFVAVLTGDPMPDHTVDMLGTDPLGAFLDSFDELRTAFDLHGVLDGTYQTPFGEQSGAELVARRVSEMTIHAWDIAVATGQSRDLDPELLAYVEREVRAKWSARTVGGPFSPEQTAPADASAADRLAALTGRAIPTPAQ